MIYGEFAYSVKEAKRLKEIAEQMFQNATQEEFIDASIHLMKAYEILEKEFISMNLESEKHLENIKDQTQENDIIAIIIKKWEVLKNVYSKKTGVKENA